MAKAAVLKAPKIPKKYTVRFILNGKPVSFECPANELFLDTIRNASLTGTKYGCRTGDCGACVILLDGKPVNSCILFTLKLEGREVTTIEGLGTPSDPHILQKTFVENSAVQCGYCTSGMILSAKSLLDKTPNPSEEEIRKALQGNLCRCTGYVKIHKAIRSAAGKMRRKKPSKARRK